MKIHFSKAVSRPFCRDVGVLPKPESKATRELTYAGLPVITYVSNSDGVLSEVRMGSKQIVSYDWSEEPYAVSVRFFNRWSINTSVMPDGSAQHENDATGGQRASGVVLPRAHELGRPTMLLDVLASRGGPRSRMAERHRRQDVRTHSALPCF
jgi:hypothetical protein